MIVIKQTSAMVITLCIVCSAVSATDMTRVFTENDLKNSGIDRRAITKENIFVLRKLLYSLDEFVTIHEGIEQFESIAEMKRVDLNADGTEDIVALMNVGATIANPVELFLFCSRGDEFIAQNLFTERGMMDDSVLDLNGDGIYEILVKSSIPGETPHVLAFYWFDVYSWDGQGYVKSDEQFFDSFYIRRYLPKISNRIALGQQLLQSGEEDTVISAVLEDCRIALEKVYTLQNVEIQ